MVIVDEPVDVIESSVRWIDIDADDNVKFNEPGFKLCLYLDLLTLITKISSGVKSVKLKFCVSVP